MTRYGGLPLAIALLLAGCANSAPPRAELGAAGAAIDTAERSGAAERAPNELNSARMKYQGANAALRDADYDRAARLAREADIDAQLATAKAEAEAARDEATRTAARRTREDATAVQSEQATPPPVGAVARSKPIPLTAPATVAQ
jgi:hypothetical protein